MRTDISNKIQYWLTSSVFDEDTKKEIQNLFDQNNEKELIDRFYQHLEFGTGGMRGVMGAGINRMNRYTVRQATEGLARYIKKHPDPNHSGVVIGYDSRHNSPEFAKTASEVLAAHNIQVFLFQKLAPTPMVSYEVLQQNAIAGIMITASHNPPEYNGYKVYWKNGGQVVPPEDGDIIHEVQQVTNMEAISTIDFEDALQDGKITWLTDESDKRYLQTLEALAVGDLSHNQELGVTYTPLHGTGIRCVPQILQRRGFQKLNVVQKQAEPDSDFSTVKSPNPEDIKAFEMAISSASPHDDLILSNDPDADRLGVMVKHKKQWQYLNGNQAGALLLDFYLNQLKTLNRLPEDGVFILSIVSSQLSAKIASSFGLQVIYTLTGFKWIWAEAFRIENEGSGSFVFGMEESLGYLGGTHCGDKDGIWAAMLFSEMAAFWKSKNLTPIDRLNQLHHQYGIHIDDLETQTLPGVEGRQKIETLMSHFRKNPPSSIGGKALSKMTDLKNNCVTFPDKAGTQKGPDLPQSNVLIFELEGHARVIVRPSGTEPKIKYYFNLSGSNQDELKLQLDKIKKDILVYDS